jgi:2'-aminobiphenyl-2,3-diol 1,2-dioxygenase small subunit
MARYEVHRLIQDLSHRPGLLEKLSAAPDDVFSEYGLNKDERQALTEATPPALAGIGVHPILQMHYLLFRNPDMAALVSIREYADWLREDA